jgi:hypothetical protein
MSIKLGNTYEDKYTGFKGTAICRSEFLYGCIRVGLRSNNLNQGRIQDECYLDESALIGYDDLPPIESSKLLGTVDEDKITGFKGTITCYSTYPNQGPRVTLTPKGFDTTGKLLEPYTVDLPQLVEANKIKILTTKTSGPGKACPRF